MSKQTAIIHNPLAKGQSAEYQNSIYGVGNVLANRTLKNAGQGQVIVRCTVTGKEVSIPESQLR